MLIFGDWHVEVAKLLLRHKNANTIDLCCNKGRTALMLAAAKGDLEIVNVLLSHKTDKTINL